ncbi:phasin PhaH [Caulobacter henricii]|uniref:Uncharacterized protein n=1 Tax=Caulobacter henricii TaxID=69395 RepID=A0A0P0NYM9_9CAUL|nr:phasin PhaH [Caulobacter henricii]ALL12845.1 hypothetical protein AQ619_05455 [Caulobacter henricii]
MVSSLSFLPEFKSERVDPETAPHVMVGAASPLWLMFGGAAAAGAAWWWWASRWREAVNLEAHAGRAPEPVAEAAAAPVVDPPVELVAEPVAFVAEEPLETLDTPEEAADAVLAPEVEIPAVVEAEAAVIEAVELVAVVEPVVEPERVAETESPDLNASLEIQADDLTRLVGIGPKLAASLTELGVTRFAQIAAWTTEDIQSIDQLLNLKGRADRDAWVAQAKRFAATVEA